MTLLDLKNGTAMITAPGLSAAAVTPSDTVDLTQPSRGIYIGVGGDVKLTTINGDTVTFAAMIGGVIYPISASRIWSTGTTATGIISVY